MFLELLNELLSDFSPIYLYLSFLLSVVYFDYIQLDFRCAIDKNHAFIRKSHALKLDSFQDSSRFLELLKFIIGLQIKRNESKSLMMITKHTPTRIFQKIKFEEDKNGKKVCIHVL
ncbi:hypothetical protein CV093_06585 [Oceanobacillus sp. 143]|nr:hypothetical protein CV093_06585 [Oceanobacillus sp. 143]